MVTLSEIVFWPRRSATCHVDAAIAEPYSKDGPPRDQPRDWEDRAHCTAPRVHFGTIAARLHLLPHLGGVDDRLRVRRRLDGFAVNLDDQVKLSEPSARRGRFLPRTQAQKKETRRNSRRSPPDLGVMSRRDLACPTARTSAPLSSGRYTFELGSALFCDAVCGVSELIEMPRYECGIFLREVRTYLATRMVAMVIVIVMSAGLVPLLPALSSRIARSAASIGIAKPMPAAFARIAVLTPITCRGEIKFRMNIRCPPRTTWRPRADLAPISRQSQPTSPNSLSSGPPELPGLIAASVWMKLTFLFGIPT